MKQRLSGAAPEPWEASTAPPSLEWARSASHPGLGLC
jgi:hypothetical protein